jgi:hypothetical protein
MRRDNGEPAEDQIDDDSALDWEVFVVLSRVSHAAIALLYTVLPLAVQGQDLLIFMLNQLCGTK